MINALSLFTISAAVRCSGLVLATLVCLPSVARGGEIGENPQRYIEDTATLVMQGEYDAAYAAFDSLQHIPGMELESAFYRMVTLMCRMEDFECDYPDRKRFENLVKETVERASKRRKSNPNDHGACVYQGNALGFMGMFYNKTGNWLRAMQQGLEGIGILEDCLEHAPGNVAPYLGIGIYKYWRSSISQKVSFLPFVDDERDEGIAMLQKVKDVGVGRLLARSQLAWMLLKYDRPEAALQVSSEGLAEFPGSRFYLWPLAESQFRLGRYAQAREYCRQICESLESAGAADTYKYLKARVKVGDCLLAEGRFADAAAIYESVEDFAVPDDARDRADTQKDWAEARLKECLEQLGETDRK